MDSKQMNKQLIYDQYLKFWHLHERFSQMEIDIFFSMIEGESIEDYPQNMTTIHVIDCIGKNDPINSTAIAEKMELSKASITKIGNKLLKDGLVKRTQMNENKKEVYFRLTPKGKRIFDLHEKMHQMEKERFHQTLDKYSDEELMVIRRFLQDYGFQIELRLINGAKI